MTQKRRASAPPSRSPRVAKRGRRGASSTSRTRPLTARTTRSRLSRPPSREPAEPTATLKRARSATRAAAATGRSRALGASASGLRVRTSSAEPAALRRLASRLSSAAAPTGKRTRKPPESFYADAEAVHAADSSESSEDTSHDSRDGERAIQPRGEASAQGKGKGKGRGKGKGKGKGESKSNDTRASRSRVARLRPSLAPAATSLLNDSEDDSFGSVSYSDEDTDGDSGVRAGAGARSTRPTTTRRYSSQHGGRSKAAQSHNKASAKSKGKGKGKGKGAAGRRRHDGPQTLLKPRDFICGYCSTDSEAEEEVESIRVDGWKFDSFEPIEPPMPFTGPSEPVVADELRWDDLDARQRSPLYFFGKLFTRDLVQQLALATTDRMQAQSRHSEAVSPAEIRAYLGVRLVMDLVKRKSTAEYWLTGYLEGPRAIREVMSRNRFEAINRHLNFLMRGERADRLRQAKARGEHVDIFMNVRPLIVRLSKQLLTLMRPGRDQCIDEAGIACKGRAPSRVFYARKNKPIPKGLNVLVVACAQSGWPSAFIIQDKAHWHGYTTSELALELTRSLVCKWHHIYFDNLYTSPRLAVDLLRRCMYSCGTLRANRLGIPAEALVSAKAKRGTFKRAQNGRMTLHSVVDNKVVTFLSTIHDVHVRGSKQVFNRGNRKHERVRISSQQQDYQRGKDPVDTLNRKMSVYDTRTRGASKWWKSVFSWLFDLSVTCAHILWTTSKRAGSGVPVPKEMQATWFRRKLAEQLTHAHKQARGRHGLAHGSRDANVRANDTPTMPGAARGMSGCVDHTLEVLEQGKRKYCAVCTATYNNASAGSKPKRKKARYYCDHCRVALCANAQRNCWKEWHRRPNMQRTCVGGAIAVDTGVAEADSDCSTASEESCDSDAEWVEVGEETTRVTYTYGAYGGDVSDADCGDGVSSDDSSGDSPFE